MFPYRRHNQRKRNKPANRRQKGGGRRLPGSARELLPLLQPATKALAQMLAGNSKVSGQLPHARNMVEKAEQLVADRQIDRLNLRDREEFLEQLARLKLTLADADDELDAAQEREAADAAAEPVDAAEAPAEGAESEQEKLRRIALALMSAPPPTETPPAPEDSAPMPEPITHDELLEASAPAPPPEAVEEKLQAPAPRGKGRSASRPRLRLRTADAETGADEPVS